MNSAWTVNPCEVTVHAQKKKKKKSGREKTRKPNGHTNIIEEESSWR